MEQVLGLDSGGTKTLAVTVGQDAGVTGVTATGGFDPTADTESISKLRCFLTQFNGPIAATLGLPYHGEVAQITAEQGDIATATLGPNTLVLNDVAVAHLGAFCGDHGVLVLAGTGAMAWATGPDGTHRASGYGDIFGDEGSAFWIGRTALAVAAREIDGRQENTGFADALCTALGITADGLINWTYTQQHPRRDIAAIAQHISALSMAGHAAAATIQSAAATELAISAQAARSHAGLRADFPWSIAGGVFADATITAELTRQIGNTPQPARLPPVGGAILDAAQRTGWPVNDEWIVKLAQNLTAEGIK